MENLYELMLLGRSDASEADQKKIFSRIDEFVKGSGKVVQSTNLGKKQLSYRVKKQTEGNYWVLDLNLDSLEVSKFSQKLSREESVLRFLLLKKDLKAAKYENKPSEERITEKAAENKTTPAKKSKRKTELKAKKK